MAKASNYLMTMYCGDTLLDVYGEVDNDEPSLGHVGGIDIEDVCIADTEISVWEMIHALDFDKFDKQAQESWGDRR